MSDGLRCCMKYTMDWVVWTRLLYLTVLEVGKSKIEVLADPMSGETHCLGCRLLPHCLLT